MDTYPQTIGPGLSKLGGARNMPDNSKWAMWLLIAQ
jgi:hypothetical protein